MPTEGKILVAAPKLPRTYLHIHPVHSNLHVTIILFRYLSLPSNLREHLGLHPLRQDSVPCCVTQAEEDALPKEKQTRGQAVSFPPKLENRLLKANWRNDGSCLKANLVGIL